MTVLRVITIIILLKQDIHSTQNVTSLFEESVKLKYDIKEHMMIIFMHLYLRFTPKQNPMSGSREISKEPVVVPGYQGMN